MSKPYGIKDVGWGVVTIKKPENDPRRHKSRCVHLRKSEKTCWCDDPQNGFFGKKCGGTVHCKFYKEKTI